MLPLPLSGLLIMKKVSQKRNIAQNRKSMRISRESKRNKEKDFLIKEEIDDEFYKVLQKESKTTVAHFQIAKPLDLSAKSLSKITTISRYSKDRKNVNECMSNTLDLFKDVCM